MSQEGKGGAWVVAKTARDYGRAIVQAPGDVGTTTGRRSGHIVRNDDSGTSLDSAGYESSRGIRLKAHETVGTEGNSWEEETFGRNFKNISGGSHRRPNFIYGESE